MHAILTVAFPVFALVGIGWLGGRLRLLGAHREGKAAPKLNKALDALQKAKVCGMAQPG